MIDINDKLYKDFKVVNQISIIPTMLEVICRTTGMGFAAVARVTDDRWLACNVRDEIDFGLAAGGELKIETTICNEIRDNHKAVIIDNVAEDKNYLDHHTPKTYGFKSYVSFPIILKDGNFFGTLCAIDPKPAQLDNPKIIGMFTLFVELLSFHLQSLELLENGRIVLEETNRQLTYTQDENLQYQQISNHNLKEPLRKIRMFSDILVNKTQDADVVSAKQIALKINSFAQEITRMIQEITEFSELDFKDTSFETVNLNEILFEVCNQLGPILNDRMVTIKCDGLPMVLAIPSQMVQLFLLLIKNASAFSKGNSPATIHIYAKDVEPFQTKHPLPTSEKLHYREIIIEDNDTEIEKYTLEKIFDFFVNLNDNQTIDGNVAGLAYCRKIVHNHGGVLTVKSLAGTGTTFSIILPINK